MTAESSASHSHDENSNKPDYAVLYLTGGAAWGKLALGPLIFTEMVTRRPISGLFNMLSGASAGATIAGTLNVPKSPGSTIPRYSALEADIGFSQVIHHSIPPRLAYHGRQLGMDLLSMMHGGFRTVLNLLCSKADYGMSWLVNTSGRNIQRILGAYEANPEKPPKEVDINFFRWINKYPLWIVNAGMGKWIDRLAQKSKYEISTLYDSLDATLRFESGNQPAKLGDTVTSHHVTSLNVTRDEPAFFANIKDINGASVYVSDPDVDLADLTTGSCAAQTIFDDFLARNGDQYCDVADVDTALSPVSTLDDQTGDKYNKKIVIIATGEPDKEDLARMPTMLFLQQMAGKLGSPLMRRRTRFVNKKDQRILRQNHGEDNVIKIDLSVSTKTAAIKYADDPKLVRMAKILGFDLLARDEMPERERMLKPNIFDTSPETMKQLSEWQWDMVWHNADKLINMSKWLIRHAAEQGRMSKQEAEETLKDIEWLYPEGDELPRTDAPPHRAFANIPELIRKPTIAIDFNEPKTAFERACHAFNPDPCPRPITVRRIEYANDNPAATKTWRQRLTGSDRKPK